MLALDFPQCGLIISLIPIEGLYQKDGRAGVRKEEHFMYSTTRYRVAYIAY